MTDEDLPTFPLASFAKQGTGYTAEARRLASDTGVFAACFSIRGKCTHGFRVIIRGVPRLFLLRSTVKGTRLRPKAWVFSQAEGGDRTIKVFDN